MLILFGHDVAIFNKNVFSGRGWAASDGTRKCYPKEDGVGVMVSALQLREFGWGFPPLTKDQVEKINAFRSKEENKHYCDRDAAEQVRKTSEKKPFDEKSNPFLVWFNYGASKDGYWSYEHLVCQLEDCQDVMRSLYPNLDVRYNVDHSCGHDKQSSDSLNVSRMKKNYGGIQPHMRQSVMVAGCLGTFNPLLNIT